MLMDKQNTSLPIYTLEKQYCLRFLHLGRGQKEWYANTAVLKSLIARVLKSGGIYDAM
jgi:hypothetical protein